MCCYHSFISASNGVQNSLNCFFLFVLGGRRFCLTKHFFGDTPPWNIFDVGKLLLTCLKGPWCRRTYTRVCLSGQGRIRSVHKEGQQTRGDQDHGVVVIWNQPFHLANLVSMWVSLLCQIMTKNETGTFQELNPTQTKGTFRRWCGILLISLKSLSIKILFPWLSQNDLLSLLVRNLQIQESLGLKQISEWD